MRPSYFNLNLELREERSRTLGWNPAGAANRCMQSGSSSRSGRNRGAAVEADAIGVQQSKRARLGAAAEADASGEHAAAAEAGTIGEQQLEADANREQQFKRMQSGQGAAADSKRMQSGGKRTQSGRAALHRELSGAGLLTVGEQGGSS